MAEVPTLQTILAGNTYPGRGIILGLTPDGRRAAMAYFIMGRSRHSQNRIFVREGEDIRTEAFDPSLLRDPSLIIYRAAAMAGDKAIVANGDQSETILEGLSRGLDFTETLNARTYEPDMPHFTPRISGIIDTSDGSFTLSILKKAGDSDDCLRLFYHYEHVTPGTGRFISTYQHDGSPLPTFAGAPKAVCVDNDLKTWAASLWEALDGSNRISLFARFIDLETKTSETEVINRYGR